ncbi:MAG: alanine--tRNA ligase [Pseudomonadota bacterium]
MKSAEIRARFLSFFEQRGHQVVASASLIPANDPTLFFVNAGMVQFKDTFTGAEQRPYRRAASVQKCLRVSGKHNDLENVGRTPRHHTFFEMLGNFSFGDYFKRDAIRWGWEFLTGELGIPAERLWVTVHHTDDEAYAIWHDEVGVPAGRIQRLGDKDNFWSMGETGPCGPCSEIHYDHGPTIDPEEGGPASESPRYVEIWNLVFMQYERQADGRLQPLPRPSIDTGAGLERIAAVLQGAYWNYDTDAFQPLIALASELSGVAVHASPEQDVALRVIADHARAAAFLVADGVMPSNEGRGYVLRRVLRRAIRYGVKIGLDKPFLWRVSERVIDTLGAVYPELEARRAFVLEVIRTEEGRFAETLSVGLAMLNEALDALSGLPSPTLDGELAFKLYDTYGFPLDLTQLIAAEHDVGLDEAGYQAAMAHQKALGRAAWKGSGEQAVLDLYRHLAETCPTTFTGYQATAGHSPVCALIRDGAQVELLTAGDEGELIVSETPFYGESGGQQGDLGEVVGLHGTASVLDCTRPIPELTVHKVQVIEGALSLHENVDLRVDEALRDRTRQNHTATHLLHAALKEVLGPHVQQKGSLVGPERLRFDFSHHKPVTRDQLLEVEDRVQARILMNEPVQTNLMGIEAARASGAQALFGEKYGEQVRVVSAAGTRELCGGTHARRTGDIGLFRIESETGIAAGVRRIEAHTGVGAIAWARAREQILEDAAAALRARPEQVAEQVERTLAEKRALQKELEAMKRDAAQAASGDLFSQARQVHDLVVLAAQLEGEPATLREEAERLRDKLGERSVVVLGSPAAGGRAIVVACVHRSIAGKRAHAGQIVKHVAEQLGGGGGGRPDMAQAGGRKPELLGEALESVYDFVAG